MVDQASGTYTYSQLMALWVQAGGSQLNAAMAAAIAMAESGGNPNSTDDDSNGTADRGLWQINSSNGSLSTYDPLGNARAAVQMSKNGTTWRPWCTAYSDGACGTQGGTYLGSGSPFMKFLGSAGLGSATNTGTNTTPNTGTQYASFPTTQDTSWYNWIVPFGLGGITGGITNGTEGNQSIFGLPLGGISSTIESGIAGAFMDVLKPVGRVLLYTLYVVGGVAMMGFGIMYMLRNTNATDGLLSNQSKPPSLETDSVESVAEQNPNKVQNAPQAQGGRGSKGAKGSAGQSSQGPQGAPQKRPGRTQKLASQSGKVDEAAEVAA